MPHPRAQVRVAQAEALRSKKGGRGSKAAAGVDLAAAAAGVGLAGAPGGLPARRFGAVAGVESDEGGGDYGAGALARKAAGGGGLDLSAAPELPQDVQVRAGWWGRGGGGKGVGVGPGGLDGVGWGGAAGSDGVVLEAGG
jgi:hypothetical protein